MNKTFKIGRTQYTLTTDHASSSYGQPVLLCRGQAHGWYDEVESDIAPVRASAVVSGALIDGWISLSEFNQFADASMK